MLIKRYEMAKLIRATTEDDKGEEFVLDRADTKTLIAAIEKSETVFAIAKAQILIEIDDQKAKQSEKPKK